MRVVDVWKRSNISTLLILPIFDDILEGVTNREKPVVPLTLIQLAFEYGLDKAYLFANDDISMEHLYLEFNERVLTNLNLTNSPYYSFSERLICCRYYDSVKRIDDRIIFCLSIPKEYEEDIKLIAQGKYSRVSKTYKKKLMVKVGMIPTWNNMLGRFIVKNNLPLAIVTKQRYLKDQMVVALGTDFSNEQEFYDGFAVEKETVHF